MARSTDLFALFVAKAVRTFCYGFLGILLPIYLSQLGLSAPGIGLAVALTLVGSAGLTWAVRRPAERYGGRAALLGLAVLSALSAVLLLLAADPALVVLAMMLGNVAVGGSETGPFLAVEQVVVTRAVLARRVTMALSWYNLLGYLASALGAAAAGLVAAPRTLFVIFLVGAGVQVLAYAWLPGVRVGARPRPAGPRPSARLIRRLAALFALDSFAGGFTLQSLVAYFFYARYGLTLGSLGALFLASQLLSAASFLLAERFARRAGLINTMVVSHAVSNVLLMGIAVAPNAGVAIALFLSRHLLSQMDVPTRQAYVMSIVEDHEREAAASSTTLARNVAQATTPAVTGWVMQAVALSAPFLLGGGLKLVYDLLLYVMFRHVKPRAEGA